MAHVTFSEEKAFKDLPRDFAILPFAVFMLKKKKVRGMFIVEGALS